MKTLQSILKFTIFFATVGAVGVLNAQPSFTFDIDDVNGHTNYTGVGASGTVDFSANGFTEVNVDLFNDSTIPALITGFYILKPMVEATALDTGPTNWELDDGNFGNVLNEFYKPGKNYTYMYFGAETDNPGNDGLPVNDPAFVPYQFTFSMDTSGLTAAEWTAYANKGWEIPHIFVRWQQVGDDGEDSAKGYTSFDGRIPPPVVVPEPALIAPLAVLGVVGMLWIRRRIVAKKK